MIYTTIIYIDKNHRVFRKKIDSLWYPQKRRKLFWFIPTPFWNEYIELSSEIIVGKYIDTVCFKTKEKAIEYLKK
jgi:predicted nucleic acid-binding protein